MSSFSNEIMFKLEDGLLELQFGDVFQSSLCVPSPVKDFGFRALELD